MKRRILTVILLFLCAVCCAIGLAACKTKDKKRQSACTVHAWTDWTEVAATCESAGFKQHVCSVCGAYERFIASPATGHDWDDWKEDAATCDDDGQRYRQCPTCGQFERIPIPKKEHAYEKVDWVWLDGNVTAVFTCVNDGNHTIRREADVAEEIVPPTVETEGKITRVATVTFEGKTYTDKKTDSVPKLDPPYTVGLAYSEIERGKEVVGYAVAGKGSATGTEITVPETYNNKPVLSVVSRAFYGGDITKLSLPETVQSIGSNAFNGCTALTDITLPDSIRHIEPYAFIDSGYYNDAANWESSALYIDNHLISVKSDISGKLTVKEGTISVADFAIRNCGSLTEINFPASVVAIGYTSVNGCTEIENITVDANNTRYADSGNCLIEISTKILIFGCKYTVIPADGSVKIIYDRAFEGINGLTGAVIPDSVTTIGVYAYSNCGNLQTVDFGNGVEEIGVGAFNICTKLKSIDLPATVKEIGFRAFYGCGGLESIKVDAGNNVYGGAGSCLIDKAAKTLLRGCKNSVIPDDGSVEIIDESAFFMCRQMKSVVIPDSVTTICEEAFSSCAELEFVTVGSGVTYIGRNAFYGITQLEAVFKVTAGWSSYISDSATAGTPIDAATMSRPADAGALIKTNRILKRT